MDQGKDMALEVRGLKKSYGDFTVSLDLSVERGETLALVGPSGSGKTTALNLIAGLSLPESGQVISDGEVITALPSWKRNISVVFQDLALFPHLDVGGNIAYGLVIRKVPVKERRRIIEEMLKIVRLPGYAARRINTLSGGERQRVAIARSLASSPRALLLDEPFSSLDAPLRKNLHLEFLDIRLHSDAPCIFVTHDREEAVTLGDRIALMSEGRIIETGTGTELFLAPKTEFAARFFGQGQVLPCKILGKREGGTEVSSPIGILIVPPHTEYNPLSPRLFIPRDALSIEEDPAAAGRRAFCGRITETHFGGSATIIKVCPEPAAEARQNRGSPPVPGEASERSAPMEQIPIELIAGPRIKPPAPHSVIGFWVDQSLLRFMV